MNLMVDTMAVEPKPIMWTPLEAEEVENLPTRVRGRLGEQVRDGDEWLVIHASWPFGGMVDRLNRLARMRTELPWRPGQDLDRMLAWLVAAGSGVETELAVDNLELRRAYLDETPTLTAVQIHRMSGLTSRNTSEPASRWKSEGKTFAVRMGRRDLYPAFQFEDGAPRQVVREVLAALPDSMTGWQKALWFASGNGWLDGDEPQQRLHDGELVVAAARQLSEPARG